MGKPRLHQIPAFQACFIQFRATFIFPVLKSSRTNTIQVQLSDSTLGIVRFQGKNNSTLRSASRVCSSFTGRVLAADTAGFVDTGAGGIRAASTGVGVLATRPGTSRFLPRLGLCVLPGNPAGHPLSQQDFNPVHVSAGSGPADIVTQLTHSKIPIS